MKTKEDVFNSLNNKAEWVYFDDYSSFKKMYTIHKCVTSASAGCISRVIENPLADLSVCLATEEQLNDNFVSDKSINNLLNVLLKRLMVEKELAAVEMFNKPAEYKLSSGENLFSKSHIFEQSNFLNKELTSETLQEAIIEVSKLQDKYGYCGVKCKKLIVSPHYILLAAKLSKEDYFAEHFPRGYVVNNYINKPFAAIITNQLDALGYWEREKESVYAWEENGEVWCGMKKGKYNFTVANWMSLYGISPSIDI